MRSHTDNDMALRLLWLSKGLDSIDSIGRSICEMIRGTDTVISIRLKDGKRVEGRWNSEECCAERVYYQAGGAVAGRGPLFQDDAWDEQIAKAFAKMQQ